MIRTFFSISFLVFGLGLPLLAGNTGNDFRPASPSSKAGHAVVLPPRPATAAAGKVPGAKKSEVVVTPDVPRGSVLPNLLAKQEAAAALLAPEFRNPTHLEPAATSIVIRNSSAVSSDGASLRTASGPVETELEGDSGSRPETAATRLARVTAYWAAEGDYYTERCISATGVRLHDGHCAVDPTIIPYGSVVQIAGVGKFLAVDTGSAVVLRTAAREGGHTPQERRAIVVDLFFEDRSAGERFAAGAAKYVSISWWTPSSMGVEAKAARGLFAEEDWTKIQSKQL